MIDLDAAAEHSRRKIREATVVEAPYPHLLVEGIWPEPLYDAFIERIPPFEDFDKVGDVTGNFFYPYLKEMCGDDQWILQGYDACMIAISLELIRRFGAYIPEYVLSLWPDCPNPGEYIDPEAPVGYPQPGLVERLSGFVQPPHLDGIFRMISAFVYLPTRSLQGGGTALYATTERSQSYSPLRNMFTRHPDGATVTLDHVNDFTRNTLFAFVNSHRAYHGISLVDYALPDDVRRLSVNMFIETEHNTAAYLIGRGVEAFGIVGADI